MSSQVSTLTKKTASVYVLECVSKKSVCVCACVCLGVPACGCGCACVCVGVGGGYRKLFLL